VSCDAPGLWGSDAVRIERLTCGSANDVWSVHIKGQLAVGRLGEAVAATNRDRSSVPIDVTIKH
jgi:hypothetical protein